MRYIYSAFFYFFISSFVSMMAQNGPIPYRPIQAALDSMVKQAGMQHAVWGAKVLDLTTHEVLASHNSAMSIPTASILKMVTTGAALGILGPEYRYKTSLEYDGVVIDSVLHGNLYIKGSGDPTLGSSRIGEEYGLPILLREWRGAVSKAGIKRITGKIIGDAEVFSTQTVPDGWIWADIGNYYGAGACGLVIDENQFILDLQAGNSEGDSVTVYATRPVIPNLQIVNELMTGKKGSGDQAYIYGAPYSMLRYLRGTIPPSDEPFLIRGSIPDPELFAADLLCTELTEFEISVEDEASAMRLERLKGKTFAQQRTVIHTHYSPPLKEIVRYTNTYSLNLYAECLLNTMAYVKTGKGSTSAGIAQVVDYWKGLGLDCGGLFMMDGSGLTPANSATPDFMAAMLEKMVTMDYFPEMEASLPIAGQTGTLHHVGKNSAINGKIKAKSGQITRVKNYAGYAQTRSGGNLCFVLMCFNNSDGSWQIQKKWEKIMEEMVKY